MHLRCPHCQNPIELADLPSGGEVTCAGCGSSFQLANFSTATWEKPDSKRIGKFEVLDTVGHGAFGTVLKAHDTELDRLVAIKIPRASNVGTSQEDVDRFLREARAVAQLRFPSIMTIHEVGADNGTPYLVSDFVEGITLADHLTGRGFSFTESAKLIAEVADALQYAHSLGVVHRDVKPSNIMIRPDGSPCVMDFGLAKRDAGEITMTIDGQILGTPAYMSPEQARGEGHQVDGKSDVYSLGVILYQLLTGELPFRGNKAMLLHQVLHDEPAAPRTLNDKIPRDLETIALKAMAKEPGRRYGSAKEMAEDLRRWLTGEPILARPVRTAERLWRWCKRKPALATANAAVLLAMITFAGAFVAVSESLQNETTQRKKTEKLADDNELLAKKQTKLADDNKLLAEKETKALREAEKLAESNKVLAEKETNARLGEEKRRRQAEILALQTRFDHLYFRYRDEPDHALVALASLLPEATRLNDEATLESMRLHLDAWNRDVRPLRWIAPHQDAVRAVAFDRDGRRILTGTFLRGAEILDTVTGKPAGPRFPHPGPIRTVVFRPDGKAVLTAGFKTAQLWDAASGKAIGPPMDHENPIWMASFSPNGKLVVTASLDGPKVWDANTGKPLGPILKHRRETATVSISPDSSLILTGSGDGTAQVWEATTGKSVGLPLNHKSSVTAVAFRPDGRMILTASADGSVRFWEPTTSKPIGTSFVGNSSALFALFSPLGDFVLIVTSDRHLHFWNAQDGRSLTAAIQHPEQIYTAAFSPDGSAVLTGAADTARLWDVQTGKQIGAAMPHRGRVDAIAFSPDGRSILTGSDDGTAKLWATATAGVRRRHIIQLGRDAVAFSPDSSKLITGGAFAKASVHIWDTTTGKQIGAPLDLEERLRLLVLSPDGDTLLTGESSPTQSEIKTVRLWGSATTKPLGPPLDHPGVVLTAAFSTDGRSVLTGGTDKTVRFWDAKTGKPVGLPQAHPRAILSAAFNSHGSSFATGYAYDDAQIWDATTRKPIGPPLRHPHSVRAVVFCADDSLVVTAGDDRLVRRWEAATGKLVGSMEHQHPITILARSRNGKLLLTASKDTVRLWDAASGKPVAPPLKHPAEVRAAAFSPDAKILVTGSDDRLSHCWETATGKLLGLPLPHAMPVHALAVSPDGRWMATCPISSAVYLWKCPQSLRGDPKRIIAWTQAVTGLEADERGDVHALTAKDWQERRDRLEKLGGPPLLE